MPTPILITLLTALWLLTLGTGALIGTAAERTRNRARRGGDLARAQTQRLYERAVQERLDAWLDGAKRVETLPDPATCEHAIRETRFARVRPKTRVCELCCANLGEVDG